MVISNGSNYALPVDRGWAWAIAAAAFMTHIISGAGGQTNSVLFVEILQKYDTSITKGSLMFMCLILAFSISSLITTTFILPKLDERRCVILGGLFCSVASICASFAPNIGVFIAAIAVKGFCKGIVFVPSLSIIPTYFNKYRSRASFIPWCGSGAATIIAPFIIRAIRKEFGVSGTYFLLGAAELHMCVAGMLMRPVSAYRVNTDVKDTSLKSNAVSTSANVTATETVTSVCEDILQNEDNNSHQEVNDDVTIDDLDDVNKSLMAPENIKDKEETFVKGEILTETIKQADSITDKETTMHSEERNTFFGSVPTLNGEIEVPLELMAADITQSQAEKGLAKWRKIYLDASLELWSFRWVLLALLTGSANIYFVSYIPTISNSQGASLDQAALLVTIMGCVDVISRICAGFIADTHVLPPSRLLAIAQMFMGIACHFFRLCTSFTSLVPMIIFIGLFIGSRGPFISLITIEVVGARKMPQAYGIVNMVTTLAGSSLNPILGAVAEKTGSFVPVMHVIGTCYILGSILLAFVPVFSRLDIKHGRKQ